MTLKSVEVGVKANVLVNNASKIALVILKYCSFFGGRYSGVRNEVSREDEWEFYMTFTGFYYRRVWKVTRRQVTGFISATVFLCLARHARRRICSGELRARER